jgi:hypothetical protein
MILEESQPNSYSNYTLLFQKKYISILPIMKLKELEYMLP